MTYELAVQVALSSEAAENNAAEMKQNVMSGEGIEFIEHQR